MRYILTIYLFCLILNNRIFAGFPEDSLLNNSINFSLTIPSIDKFYPKIAVILSGGGSRGLSQIGVLEIFEKSGIKIDYITGTSIGAIVGGLYASGYTASEMDSIVTQADWNEILSLSGENFRSDYFMDQKVISDRSLLTLRFNNFKIVYPEAISGGTRFNAFLQDLIWSGAYQSPGNFDNLKYPFRAITTDLVKGESISLKSGNLVTAMRASSSVPLRTTPVKSDSMILVDGGLMANIPLEAAREFNPDLLIVVNTTSPLLTLKELDKPWNLADQVVSIMMKYFNSLSVTKADILIEPKLGSIENTDFTGIDSLILLGRIAANKKLNDIKMEIDAIKDSSLEFYLSKIPVDLLFNKDVKFKISGFKSLDSLNIVNIVQKCKTKQAFNNNLSSFLKNISFDSLKFSVQKIDSSFNVVIELFIPEMIKEITFSGNPELISADLKERLNKKFLGTGYGEEVQKELKDSILQSLKRDGYFFINVNDFKFNSLTNILNVQITQSRIKNINIIGNEHTSSFLISRELDFREGETVNPGKIRQGWNNLVSCGLFSDAEMQVLSHYPDSGVDISVHVKEIGTQILSLGGRIDNERNAQLGLDIIQENFLNLGARISGRAAGGGRNFSSHAGFEVPRIFSTSLTFSVIGYYNYKKMYNYSPKKDVPFNEYENISSNEIVTENYGSRLLTGTQIGKKGNITGEIRYERQRFYDLPGASKMNYYTIQSAKIGSIYDTEDRSDFPTNGHYIAMSLETGLFQPENAISFSKIFFSYRYNFTFGISTLKPFFCFGFADATLPLPEMFSLGGQDLFYGMREDEYLGRQLALGSLEYRIKSPLSIIFDTYLSLRYDVGAAWPAPETIKLNTLNHGVGLCIALDTPLGPGKFSAGRALYFSHDKDRIIYGPYLFYFSIGIKI